MKYMFGLLFSLFLMACTDYSNVKSDGTKVTINGKQCELFLIDSHITFIDCGPGSSATMSGGKNAQTVGIYNPSVIDAGSAGPVTQPSGTAVLLTATPVVSETDAGVVCTCKVK